MIATARLTLRQPRLDDFEASYALSSDPGVVRFIGGKPATREEAWTKLLRNIGHWAALGHGLFTVVETATSGFVGETGLARFQRGLGPRFDPAAEAAWVIARERQGAGFAMEAAAAVHDWFDRTRGRERTVCLIHPENGGSLRIAARLGYRAFDRVDYRGSRAIMLERCSGA